MTAFTLRTPRLVLRRLVPDDAQAMFDLNADPEVLRFTIDKPRASVEEARRFLEAYQAVYRDDGFARWAAIEEATGEWLGWCGLRRQTDGDVDVGYRYRRAVWGRGFATEGARASLAYGFDELRLERIIGVAHIGNAKSIRVLEKIGLRFERSTTDGDVLAVLWSSSRERWTAERAA